MGCEVSSDIWRRNGCGESDHATQGGTSRACFGVEGLNSKVAASIPQYMRAGSGCHSIWQRILNKQKFQSWAGFKEIAYFVIFCGTGLIVSTCDCVNTVQLVLEDKENYLKVEGIGLTSSCAKGLIINYEKRLLRRGPSIIITIYSLSWNRR